MTDSLENLTELRFLRERPLPSGFEERLRERLIEVANEKRVVLVRTRIRPKVWFLLAAVALPVAAFAAAELLTSGRVFHQTQSEEKPAQPKRAVERKQPQGAAFTRHAASTANTAAVQPPTPAASSSTVDERDSTSKATTRTRAGTTLSKTPSKKPTLNKVESVTTHGENTQPLKSDNVEPATAETGRAHIESLEISVPKSAESTTGDVATKGANKGLRLRSVVQQGDGNRTLNDSEVQRRTQNREQRSESRGNVSGTQSRERNQERVRKGQ
jgi:hypothetical protein